MMVKCAFDFSAQQEIDRWSGEVGLIHHGDLGELGSWRLQEIGASLSTAERHSFSDSLLHHPSLDEGPSRENRTRFCSNPKLQIYFISSQ